MATTNYAAIKELCQNPEADPVALAHNLDQACGVTHDGWRNWEPEMLASFTGLSRKDVQQMDKLMATQVAVTNSDVFEDWHLFHHCAVAFNHRRANFNWLDRISYIEAAWACECLNQLAPAHSYGPGILRYLKAICQHDGLVFFPWVGGDGLSIGHELVTKVKTAWDAGSIKELAPSDVDDTNILHVQLAKLVNACEYIRECKKRGQGVVK
jgi:hypothetical protein